MSNICYTDFQIKIGEETFYIRSSSRWIWRHIEKHRWVFNFEDLYSDDRFNSLKKIYYCNLNQYKDDYFDWAEQELKEYRELYKRALQKYYSYLILK